MLPGQHVSLHICVIESSPGQTPSISGQGASSHTLILVCSPYPHVSEHSDQSCQFPQLGGSVRKERNLL